MKTKECEAVAIQSLSHDGRGIAVVNHKKTFIRGALPTETVTYSLTKKRSHYNEAEVIAVVNPAAERVVPPCQHAHVCGGCSLQHMNMQTQLTLKQQTLLDQLKHFGQVTPAEVLPPLSASTTGYRRKARLGVKFVIKKEKLLIGFREKSSNYLADIERCAVLQPRVGEHLDTLNQLISSLDLAKQIPQIEVAMGDEDLALVLRHLEPMTAADKEKLCAFAESKKVHIYLQPNPPLPITKLWPNDAIERLTYTLPEYQLEFLFHPLDFTQINLEMNRCMVQQALSLLDVQPHETVLDLFCGIGNFSLAMARQAARVVGIEGSVEMVKRATDNAAHNQINNTAFYTANLMQPVASTSWLQTVYDKILLDPPRAGAQEILPYLQAQRIVYVSCNPATLARDAGILVHQLGYILKQVGIINMFAHTAHIEAMAVFEKE
jgi:23S rRNA (uracil1939-C5)-methyltransferase